MIMHQANGYSVGRWIRAIVEALATHTRKIIPLLLYAMTKQTEVTYKLFLEGKDQTLDIHQIDTLYKSKRIKPNTRIYNNETKCWIDFKDYSRLFKMLNTLNRFEKSSATQGGGADIHPLLLVCGKCGHPYSKRADKCPRCGNAASFPCSICKTLIPKSSAACPECGDPEPFERLGKVFLETPIPHGVTKKQVKLQSIGKIMSLNHQALRRIKRR